MPPSEAPFMAPKTRMSVMANKGAACGCCSPQVRSVRAFDQKHFEINRRTHPGKRGSECGIKDAAVRGTLHGAKDTGTGRGGYSFDPESKELDAETLQSYIYGAHVSEFMESLEGCKGV
jgi:hypothetical protein